ncbi:MAG: drug resistance transporter, EmrB/QacA subfamily [Frankiales bacterium]|nr:drug resistance transporter, EmrB/QacA subfamily [Frankiales bacterium]
MTEQIAPPAPTPTRDTAVDPHHEHRWLILGVIGIAQLMVVLDATIVNIALPSAQKDLGFSDASRQWVITSYALAFGSLLLLGGRLADLFGRKRAFITGLLGFAAASALGGAAPGFAVLILARVLQGSFGALLAPAALSLLATTFLDPQERAKAFGIFGAIAGAGGAVGLLLGGFLTEYLDWRWCLYVTLLFAIPAAIAGSKLLHPRAAGVRPPLDLPGTALATTGLLSLVYGFSHAETHGWGHPLTLALFGVAAVLVGCFVLWQRRSSHPLLPMRIVLDRNRGGAYLAMMLGGTGIFGVFIFVTFFLQVTLGLSPIRTGLAFMPMNLSIVTTAVVVNTRLLMRTGPKPLIPTGMVLGAIGLLLLSRLTVESSYAPNVLPSMILIGVGMGLIFAPSFAGATTGVGPQDSGVASAMVNTSQQVGGAIGTALLSTIVASGAASYLTDHPGAGAEAAVNGYTWAFLTSAGVFLFGAVVCGLLLRPGVPAPAHAAAAPAAAH